MKKNYFLRAAALLLVFSMFGMCIVPHTLGRYTGAFTVASNTVRAGIFEVCIQRRDGTWESIVSGPVGQTFLIDLYQTLYQENITTAHPMGIHPGGRISDSPQPDLGDEALIAPGCGGRFIIKVKNCSEVSVDWKVVSGTLSAPGSPNNMFDQIEWFHLDDPAPGLSTWKGNAPVFPTVARRIGPLGAEDSYGFQWRWCYERGGSVDTWGQSEDIADIALGINGKVVYTLPLTVHVVQAD